MKHFKEGANISETEMNVKTILPKKSLLKVLTFSWTKVWTSLQGDLGNQATCEPNQKLSSLARWSD